MVFVLKAKRIPIIRNINPSISIVDPKTKDWTLPALLPSLKYGRKNLDSIKNEKLPKNTNKKPKNLLLEYKTTDLTRVTIEFLT